MNFPLSPPPHPRGTELCAITEALQPALPHSAVTRGQLSLRGSRTVRDEPLSPTLGLRAAQAVSPGMELTDQRALQSWLHHCTQQCTTLQHLQSHKLLRFYLNSAWCCWVSPWEVMFITDYSRLEVTHKAHQSPAPGLAWDSPKNPKPNPEKAPKKAGLPHWPR